jgi:SAM-dependent methyltransferase
MPELVWDTQIYANGKFPRAPFDMVASFVYRNAPPLPREQVSILELGCGSGNNVWFLASEGFRVTGTDASPRAIEYAKNRVKESGLQADLRVESFPTVTFPDGSFDLVFERGALIYVTPDLAAQTIREVRRVLKPGGRFFLNLFSGQCDPAPGYTCYYDRSMVERVLEGGWKILRMHHAELRDFLDGEKLVTGDWRVEVEKI